MSTPLSTSATSNGLLVKAYSGDRSVMLAFNLDDHLKENLAGFAIRRRFQRGPWAWLQNRLSFDSDYTKDTTATDRTWSSSDVAPFQKFWWVDFPPENNPGNYEYEVTVMRFTEAHGPGLKPDQSVTIEAACMPFKQGNFELAFTRGYLSSQAYSDKFHNASIRPKPKSIDYDTTPYRPQYEWLGAHARNAIIDFLARCHNKPSSRLAVMAYDLDEPDIIRALAALGKRIRVIVDDASLHTGPKAMEPLALDILRESAGGGQVKTGHFSRYQHNKVFILYEDDKPVSVLTGSTNFSVTGLYVNANHVAVFNDPVVADLYSQMFDAAFDGGVQTQKFQKPPISHEEHEVRRPGLPLTRFSFAPHARPTFSLNRLLDELTAADSSVLFAVMALQGGGKVLDKLRSLHADGKVFSYGVTDNPGTGAGGAADSEGITVFKPGADGTGVLIGSAALSRLVPPPFSKEAEEGLAHKIHHKFVVVDFNDTDPVVFFGSSNLAELGEESNGDNLIAMYDRGVATVFAIEAIRLVDHYAFRAALQKATKVTPMRLRFADEHWETLYYQEGHLKCRERRLFSR